MQFINYDSLPEIVKQRINARDFNGYIRVCHKGFRYSLDQFYRDVTSDKIEELKIAEKQGLKCHTEEIKKEIQTVCKVLFEENNQRGRLVLYDYCKENDFQETETIYLGFCETEHCIFEIVVSKEDGYFCRVYFYEK